MVLVTSKCLHCLVSLFLMHVSGHYIYIKSVSISKALAFDHLWHLPQQCFYSLNLTRHLKFEFPPSFDSDLPPSPPPGIKVLGVQVSPLKWVSEVRTSIVGKVTADSDQHGRDDKCAVSVEAQMEKRFQEALRLSCW